MSASTVLSAIASQFDSDSARSEFLDLAENRVNRECFGSNEDLAVAYMTAHMMTLRDLSTKAGGLALGAVSSMKEGDVTLSMFKEKDNTDSMLGVTAYGQQFLSLQNGSIAPIGLTGLSGFHAN